MNPPAIDWKALEFTCVKEADVLPSPDPEADAWFQQGNALFKEGFKNVNEAQMQRAAELMLKAAERRHVKAMNNLVVYYLDGSGVKQSDAKAVEWAEKLIKLDIGMGYYHMGVFLEQGIGVKQDRKAALTYFRKAADLGNAQGQLAAGGKILTAFAQSPDHERGNAIGTAMLKCALSQGLAEAGYKLGFHYSILDAAEALKAFQAAAKLGHQDSLFSLRTIFEEGKYDLKKDQARAACYKRLLDESDRDKTKQFPDLDRICPLPPTPMPK